jgi:L-ascorbate metabolism protein UlaG (beta-lactamase superfamily)
MKMKPFSAAIAALIAAFTVSMFAAGPPQTFWTQQGPLTITPIMHASLMLEGGGQVIYVDPAQGSYDGLPQADVILITDIHGDHMQPAIVEKLKKVTTQVFAPAAVQKTITSATVMNNGDKKSVGRYDFLAVPMYNMKPDEKGQIYHEKGRGNGYVITFGNFNVYVAGDTEGTPEMRALRNIDVAFIPMNLPYTMTAEAAADAIRAFAPKRVYPYHYQGMPSQDPKVVAKLLENTPIDVKIVDWYAK